MKTTDNVTVRIEKKRATSVSRYGQQSFIATNLYVLFPTYKMAFSDYLQDKFGYWTKDLTNFNNKVWNIVKNSSIDITERENTISDMVTKFVS